MAQNKKFALLSMAMLMVMLGTISSESIAETETNGWQVISDGGVYSEIDGLIMLSGDDQTAGPTLIREFTPPQENFEISMDLMADTLGEVSRDPLGAGEGFEFGLKSSYYQQFPGIHFSMRARAGGQFLLVWHDDLCDQNGWVCNWEPFVQNGLEYNDGYSYWHPNPPQDRSNATIKPDVWYTIKLNIQKDPFTLTGEAYTQEGVLLGSLTIDSMNDLTFDTIRYCVLTTYPGGTFYVRNIKGLTSDSLPSVSTSSLTVSTDSVVNKIGSVVNIQGKLTDQNGNGIANEPIVLSYTFGGADSWYPIGSAFTGQDGKYSIQWINTTSGTVTLNAQWKGNSIYTPANVTTTLSFLPLAKENVFLIESNSTITAISFNSSLNELSFNASGESGTSGHTRIFIAKTLMSESQNLTLYLDGKTLNYQLSESAEFWILSFTYNHSIHKVTVYLPQTITESKSLNPYFTLNSSELFAASVVALVILLIVGLLLLGFKKQQQ